MKPAYIKPMMEPAYQFVQRHFSDPVCRVEYDKFGSRKSAPYRVYMVSLHERLILLETDSEQTAQECYWVMREYVKVERHLCIHGSMDGIEGIEPKCKFCEIPLLETFKFCPQCGYPTDIEPESPPSEMLVFVADDLPDDIRAGIAAQLENRREQLEAAFAKLRAAFEGKNINGNMSADQSLYTSRINIVPELPWCDYHRCAHNAIYTLETPDVKFSFCDTHAKAMLTDSWLTDDGKNPFVITRLIRGMESPKGSTNE